MIAAAYLEAEEIRLSNKNFYMWMQGRYNFEATDYATQRLAWGMGGGKGKKPEPYPQKPFPMTKAEIEAEAEERKKKTLDFFMKGQKGGSGG